MSDNRLAVGVAFWAIIFFLPAELLAATLQLPQTGQTICYSATGSIVNCASTGQDGDIQGGIAWPLPPRFNPNFTGGSPDGTITDELTGLTWLQNPGCFNPETWLNAVTQANALSVGDPNCPLTDGSLPGDWRLPNVNEMESLIHAGVVTPATWLNTQGFVNVQNAYYWTATSDAFDPTGPPGRAWHVGLENGYVNSQLKTQSHYFWPVKLTTTTPAQVWRTGQIGSYASGDDGAKLEGVNWPAPRFTDNQNGTVTDNLTGLVWLKNAGALGCFDLNENWQDALSEANALSDGGMYPSCDLNDGSSPNDWRLPNRKELFSLIDRSQNAPALLIGPFTGVGNDVYWSATTMAKTPHYAWGVSLQDGQLTAAAKNLSRRVWPVRDGDIRWLRITVNGDGLVTTSPNDIHGRNTCSGSCRFGFPKGMPVALQATPHPPGSEPFLSWTDACTGAASSCNIVMTQNRDVTANFNLTRIIRLTGDLNFGQVNVGGTATRTLTIHNDGNDTLNVVDIQFSLYSGIFSKVSPPLPPNLSIPPGSSQTVFISFNPPPLPPPQSYVDTLEVYANHTSGVNTRTVSGEGVDVPITSRNLTIQKSGTGSGRVFTNPPGINCDESCETESAVFPIGTTVTLTAIPDANSVFEGWLGLDACDDDQNICTFLPLENNITVIAKFRVIPDVPNYTLTVIKTGSGDDGLVFSNPAGIDAGSASADFAEGTDVILTALPTANITFTGWQGACTGTNPVCTLTITQNTTVVANFEAVAYHSLTILKIGTGAGLVYSNPSGVAWGVDIDCGSDCATSFRHGTKIVLSAEAIGDSAFAGWGSGVCSGQGTDCALTIDDNYTILVEFRHITAGSLITTITPPQAIDAEARWRVNNGIWNLSGARADNLPPGSNTVEYLPVTGWNAPSPQSVIVSDGGVSTTSAHYTRATGRLKILISPPEAVRAGAQWRLNEGVWYDSGTEVSGVAGQQQLDFKSVANWAPPAGVGVLVNNGESLIQTYTYTRQVITPADNPGSITVHIAPSNIDAQWKLTGLTGDEVWRRSGETRSGLKVASAYTITFSHVGERWQRPRDIVTLLGSDATTAARQFHVNYLDLAATDCLFDWFETEYGVFFNPPSTTSAAPVDHTDLLYRCYVNTNSCVGAHETRLLYYGPLSDNTLLDAGSTAEWYHSSDCRE